METTHILTCSRICANNTFDDILHFDAILHFDVALIVSETPIINTEENMHFITKFINKILSSQVTKQHRINILYLTNKIIYNNIWWLEFNESTLKFNKTLINKNKTEYELFKEIASMDEYNTHDLLVFIPQIIKKQELIVKHHNTILIAKLVFNNVLNIIKNDLYNPCVYIEYAHKPPYGLIPNRLMREDLNIY